MIIGWSPGLDSESTVEVRSIDSSVDTTMGDTGSFDTADFTFEFSDQNYRLLNFFKNIICTFLQCCFVSDEFGWKLTRFTLISHADLVVVGIVKQLHQAQIYLQRHQVACSLHVHFQLIRHLRLQRQLTLVNFCR